MNKSPQSHQEKEKNGFWLLNPASKFESILLIVFFLFLPTQIGKHFWPDFALVSGLRIDYLSPTVYVTDLLILLLFLIVIARSLRRSNLMNEIASHSPFARNDGLRIGTSLFVICFFLINIFLSERPLLSLYGLLKLGEFTFLSLYLAKTIRQQYQLQMLALLFAISASFESVLAIAQFVQQGSLNGIFYFFGERTFAGSTPGIANASLAGELVMRPYGTFPHPNVLAGYLLVSIVLVWRFLLLQNRRWMQVFGSLTVFISSIALLLTFSRIVILLWILLVCGTLAWTIRRKIPRMQNGITVFVLLLVGILFISILPASQEVILRFSQTSLGEESVAQRATLISHAFTMLMQQPFFGVGLGTFIPALAPLQQPLALGLSLQPVHNIFLLVAAETGIIGLGLFVWFLLKTIRRVINQNSSLRGIFFVLLFIVLVTGLFDHYWLTLQQGKLLFATILGLCWMELK